MSVVRRVEGNEFEEPDEDVEMESCNDLILGMKSARIVQKVEMAMQSVRMMNMAGSEMEPLTWSPKPNSPNANILYMENAIDRLSLKSFIGILQMRMDMYEP